MAQFPKYERRISAGKGQPFTTTQPNTEYAKSLQRLGANVSQMGMTIGEIDNKVRQIEQVRESTDKQISIQRKINEYNLKFSEDMNPDNWQGYYDGLQSDVLGIVNDTEDPFVKQQVSRDAQQRVDSTLFAMKSKAVDRNDAMAKRNVEILGAASINAVNTNNEALILDSRITYQKAVNDYAKMAGLPQEWVIQTLAETDKKRASQIVDNTAATNTARALELLDDLSGHFTAEEKTKKEIEIKNLGETLENIAKDDIADNALNVYNSTLNELGVDPFKYTPTELEAIGLNTGMSRANINKLKNFAINDPNVAYDNELKLSQLKRDRFDIFKKRTGKPTKTRLGKRKAGQDWLDRVLEMRNDGYITNGTFSRVAGDVLSEINPVKVADEESIWSAAVSIAVTENPSSWYNNANKLFDSFMGAYNQTGVVPIEQIQGVKEELGKQQQAVANKVKANETAEVSVIYTRDEYGNLVTIGE